jgi:hypothetical protein
MEMEAVKQIINSSLLNNIINLPRIFQNKKVELTISLAEEKAAQVPLTTEEIDAMLKGSVTESLIGALPYSEKTLEEYRMERLSKYECID